ncbi:S8 family serine peptidase [Hymenobacter sp. 15J16-1T3B]|uniref:S8 family serine peptidase n=1 Tax=Hymenobacter sp. 15J16-1T3B TaxID=2886941 RepID=UPI001D0F8E4F|nr:S8 family serine peptidase [Hymenobacter sp. 15J16-1T3B]MCC3157021.1 S8 family serine peptidase [Hymenobacter sp. 15J16-1T3B]
MLIRLMFAGLLAVAVAALPWCPAAPRPVPSAPPGAAPVKCWVFLRDKHGVAFDAATYFSPQARARRRRQHLPAADSTDFPLRLDYLRQVHAAVDSVTGTSRWFNAVACWATPAQVAALRQLPGVRAVEAMPARPLQAASRRQPAAPPAAFRRAAWPDSTPHLTAEERQLAQRQTRTLGGEVLRRQGLDGRGLRIAVLDVGFSGAGVHPALAQLRRDQRIVATYDFMRRRPDAFHGGSHGTEVLACLAGRLSEGIPLGLAPQAEYLLARTEALHRETFGEEEAWLAAAEWADRLGADIINSSLGYTDTRYFREQMNGRTSLVARAANLAARKGMLVVCAAGNDGDDDRWRLVGTPADADSVLAVGALDPDTWLTTDFSSCGPAVGGRLKPNLTAFGVVMTAAPGGDVQELEGTSFASPLVAGLAACVWQQRRGLKAMELFRLLEHSGTLYPYFDYAHGYGLPQAGRCLTAAPPAPVAPTLDIVATTGAVQVVVRPEATLVLRPLPLFADSVAAVGTLAESSRNAPPVPRPGRERSSTARPAPSPAPGLPLPLPYPDYCYWHLADARGRLRRYEVLEVSQRAVLRLPAGSWQPGDVLRVHYRGYTAEKPLP